jgi:hypothetical protein
VQRIAFEIVNSGVSMSRDVVPAHAARWRVSPHTESREVADLVGLLALGLVYIIKGVVP